MRWLYPDAGNFLMVVSTPEHGLAIRRVKQGMLATRSIPIHSFRAPVWAADVDQ